MKLSACHSSLRLQDSMLRASSNQVVEAETQEEGRDSRVAALVEEAERLKATIAKQQKEISALQQEQRQQPQPSEPAHPPAQSRQVQSKTSEQPRPQQAEQRKKQTSKQTEHPKEQNLHAAQDENWTCAVCTFENVEPLMECEMCGVQRACASSPRRKRQKKGPPPGVLEVDAAWQGLMRYQVGCHSGSFRFLCRVYMKTLGACHEVWDALGYL